MITQLYLTFSTLTFIFLVIITLPNTTINFISRTVFAFLSIGGIISILIELGYVLKG